MSDFHGKNEKVIAYWNFDELQKKCVGKIRNTIYVLADSIIVKGQEEFKYEKIELLEDFAFNNLLRGLINGSIFIDFDARTVIIMEPNFVLLKIIGPFLFSKITILE